MIVKLCDGWQISKDGARFAPVSVPHDYLIDDPLRWYDASNAVYTLVLPGTAPGERVFIRFDGVCDQCEVYVNGRKLGEWGYAFTAFEVEITDALKSDASNILEVRVIFPGNCARWYTGAGIYRDVYLITRHKYHIKSDSVYISTQYENGVWSYVAAEEVDAPNQEYKIRRTLLDNGQTVTDMSGIIPWDVFSDNPKLYELRTDLIVNGETVDSVTVRFGFRHMAYDADKGFYLNGRHVKLNGVCLHQEMSVFGAAVPLAAIHRQLDILRGMGVNAIRTAHNPPSSAFMDICDERGFLVLSELCDVWKIGKTPNDYSNRFDARVEMDAASWIRRDRNHPCVVMWSVGNEIADTHASYEDGFKTLERLINLVERHDPRGSAPVTLCSNYMAWENTERCASELLTNVGYNYSEFLYDGHHAKHPNWAIYGSETGSIVHSRGIYHFPLSQVSLSEDDLQCSSLGNSRTSWGADSYEKNIFDDTAYSLGQFVWSGQDYLGEPTPYKTKTSYFGLIDTAGLPKDAYHVFKMAWTEAAKPAVHLFPYWDYSIGQMIDVRAASNAYAVELTLNGQSLGRQELNGRILADWCVRYEPGEIKVIAYNRAGEAVASDSRHSFGDMVSLQVTSSTYDDMTFFHITALDADSNVVSNANDLVDVIAQNGELLGIDNGNSADWSAYYESQRRLFSGEMVAVVRQSPDEIENGKPTITAEIIRNNQWIRKIELTRDGLNFKATTYPSGADYPLEWSVTNAMGIDSPCATLTVSADGRSAALAPKSDGVVYIRCGAKNGLDHLSVLTALDYEITGFGDVRLSAHKFISGGLCDASNVRLTPGNDRGVATLRLGESHVGFRNIDFGAGSDRFTIWLFPLESNPFDFEVWQGMPGDGGKKLSECRYDRGSKWNTYIEAGYTLPAKLTSVCTLCFVFRQKVHVKGFQFH
ncbi:hypothetical protein FACS18948_0240 [Clostridia bacterium]|nr:hypothetical protein FACS18948_0240 [Clostridia bacterium]